MVFGVWFEVAQDDAVALVHIAVISAKTVTDSSIVFDNAVTRFVCNPDDDGVIVGQVNDPGAAVDAWRKSVTCRGDSWCRRDCG